MTDARFADGDDAPLRLMARDADDLAALSALVQDAILTGDQMRWLANERKFALFLKRFRWENPANRSERVQAILAFDDVMKVASQGVSRDGDTVLSLLSLEWTAGEDGTGRITLNFAGDGALALDVECLEVSLRDVTRPYHAPSGQRPAHPE